MVPDKEAGETKMLAIVRNNVNNWKNRDVETVQNKTMSWSESLVVYRG